ncbi:MAG: glycoside hydrolase family 35 protein [Propioniciclava sp.]
MTTFTIDGAEFVRDGRPHRILSGALHYFRIHPGRWRRQLTMLRAMGLNTVETYVPWNLHERTEGVVTGLADLARFLDLAGEQGLDAIVRPGPYICAEWENGGIPAWLTHRQRGRIRCADPGWLAAVDRWFDQVLPVTVARQVTRGGNVIMVQVENEYGSFGSDAGYLDYLRDGLLARGVEVPLFTSDGPEPWMLAGGIVDGVLATLNFGSGAQAAFQALAERRPGTPRMCMEFWNGWFDHWGAEHTTRGADDAVAALTEILVHGGSVNLYMAQGGTNFGAWAGGNRSGDRHDGAPQSTITSYDYDAPIDERGEPTAKFHSFRAAVGSYATLPPVDIPEPMPLLPPTPIAVVGGPAYLATGAVGEPVHTALVPSLDDLGVDQGIAHHSFVIGGPRPTMPLICTGVGDRLAVYAAGELVAHAEGPEVVVELPPVPASGLAVDLVVDSLGRVNYGPLLGEDKGITGQVRHGNQLVHQVVSVAGRLDELPAGLDDASFADGEDEGGGAIGPRYLRGTFWVEKPADAWLQVEGSDRVVAWVGGFCLGRLLAAGPQGALYVPAESLVAGSNRVVLLDLAPADQGRRVTATLTDTPRWCSARSEMTE